MGLQIHIGAEEHAVSQLVHIVASHRIVLGGRQGRCLVGRGNDNAVLVAALGAGAGAAALITGAASQQAQQHHCGQKQAEQPNFSVSHGIHLIKYFQQGRAPPNPSLFPQRWDIYYEIMIY
ncbi:hypothetical protein DW741_14345 [Ruminococcaceae bacterium AM28-23LB]|nr:hypothetical protein DW741_14345 [Ruminococcaceae bacterium AM28-23LB]